MVTALPIIGSIVLLCASLVALIAFTRWRDHRIRQLYANTKRDGLRAHSTCMIRDGGLHCPGVALVADDTLQIHSIFNKIRVIPLSTVRVTREETGRCGSSGGYEWRVKQVFHLDTPETANLAIGVKEPEPWRAALMQQAGGKTVIPTL